MNIAYADIVFCPYIHEHKYVDVDSCPCEKKMDVAISEICQMIENHNNITRDVIKHV